MPTYEKAIQEANAISIVVSIVIPTYNRPKSLIKCLDSLVAQDYPTDRYEIIVVDDGSAPDALKQARHHIDSIRASTGINARLLAQENSGPGVARNRGVDAASGEVIGFVDDDCVCHERWISSAMRLLTDHSTLTGVEGMTLAVDDGKPPVFAHRIQNTTGHRFLTCNLFVRREWLQRVGGFDPRFFKRGQAPTREDSDLAFSILEAGGSFAFAENVLVKHPTRPTSWCEHWATARHGLFEPLLRAKHRRIFSNPKAYGLTRRRGGYAIFPLYYGHYLSVVLLGVSALTGRVPIWMPLAGLALSVLAVAVKHQLGRHFRIADFAKLCVVYTAVPFMRLFYLARGYYDTLRGGGA